MKRAQTAKKKEEPTRTILSKIGEWLEARQIILRAERIKSDLQPDIEKALKEAPDNVIEYGTQTLELSEFEREYLDAKAAELNLGKAALAPFWKKTKVTQIRVK
jgi:hypothetical protein